MKNPTPKLARQLTKSFHNFVARHVAGERRALPPIPCLASESLEDREMLSAAFFSPAETSGSVHLQLVPLANVTPGTPEVVTFGLPLTRGSVTPEQLSQVRVLKNGVEIPAFVEQLTAWRSIDDASIDNQSVRVARIQISYTFAALAPETITVQWGGPARALHRPAMQDPRLEWHTVTNGTFVAADNVEEPDVLPVLPKEHLAKGMLDSRMDPTASGVAETRDDPAAMDSMTFSGYTEYDYAEKNFFYTIINQNPGITIPYKTSSEPWLYDRSSAMYELYLRSGFGTALREAVRNTDFYVDRLNANGFFTLANGDPKLAYNESLAYTYWLLGDNRMLAPISTVVTAHNGTATRWTPNLNFFTERNIGYKLLANEIAYEVTGNALFKNNVQTIVNDLIWHQNGAGGQLPSNRIDGGLYHTGAQHDITEASSGSVLIASPWMSAMVVDPMVRVYGVWQNSQIASFVVRMGNFEKVASKTDPNGQFGGTMRYPDYLMRTDGTSDARSDTDVQHAIDVGAVAAWATYFAEVLGTPDPALRQLANDLYATYDAGVNYWTRPGGTEFNVSPPRRYAWEYKNSASFSWALTGADAPGQPGAFRFSAAAYSADENGGTATITVTRIDGTAGSVSVNYATSNGTATAGSDYTPVSGMLTFAAGETSKTFAVPIIDDPDVESSETIALGLSNPTGGATLGSPAAATLTIASDDTAQPGTLQLLSATANGQATLTVTYQISGSAAPAFYLGAYRSADETFGGDLLLGGATISAPADLAVGMHTKTWTIGSGAGQIPLPGAGASEVDSDYFLLFVADAPGSAPDSVATFAGVYHPASGPVMVQGGSGADVVSVDTATVVTWNGATYAYTPSTVTGLRVRTHGGDDTASAVSATKSLVAWGGAGSDRLTGGAAADSLFGGIGNDTLTGNAGSDRLVGEADNDTYVFDSDAALGSDTLDESGGGFDTLDFSATTTQSVAVNLTWAAGQTVNPNLWLGIGSATTFEKIIGGALNDTLTGNALANVFVGGAGNDKYVFDADTPLGSDTLDESGGGIDTIDFSLTTTQAVALNLGLATSQIVNPNLSLTLLAGETFENATGGAIGDTLTGNGLANVLTGNAGNDTLGGGAGNDRLVGWTGNDVYLFDADASLGSDTLDETGGGIDTLDFSATSSIGVTVNLEAATAQVVNANLTLTLGAATTFENIIGGAQADTLTGNSLANALTGTSGNDWLNGSANNDTLVGGDGNDTLVGGAGYDLYLFDADASLGSDTLDESGGGIDTLDFSATTSVGVAVNLGLATSQVVHSNLSLTFGSAVTFENLIGGAQADTLTGNTLANALTGGAGNDHLSGGTGSDTYLFDTDTNLGSDTVVEFAGAGADSLDFSQSASIGVALDLANAAQQIVNGNLRLTLSAADVFENAVGGALNDQLTGNALANLLSGRAGNDTLAGGDGNDTYEFDADTALGSDTLVETTTGGVDVLTFWSTSTRSIALNLASDNLQSIVSGNLQLTLSAGNVFEIVYGGSLDDVLTGNALANTLSGGAGNDTLQGAEGDDVLIGGAGNDALNGSSGNDRYSFDADSALGDDTISEAVGGGTDLVDFSQTTTVGAALDLSITAAQTVNANLTLTLADGGVIENVNGGGLDDTLTGNALPNVLTGNAGNDTLNGVAANDALVGGAGNDTLNGGAGDDVYSFDADVALGADILVESPGGGGVDLLDFSPTTTIGVSIDLASTAIQVVNARLTLTLSAGTIFERVVGTPLADSLRGNGLHNVLIGGAGNDGLFGLAGRDLLVGGTGADSLTGGDDDDLLISGIVSYFNESTKVLNRPAIDAIMAEWTRADGNTAAAYAARIANLRGGGGNNGSTLLNGLMVLSDGSAIDTLFGEIGLDWFWKFGNDATGDLGTGGTETVN